MDDPRRLGLPDEMNTGRRIARFWLWVQAYLHANNAAVCEMSRGMPVHTCYHDWYDGVANQPWHLYTHTCRRCGKKFTI